MPDSSSKVRTIADYNQIFVKLDEKGASIVNAIRVVSDEAAAIAQYTDAVDLVNRAAPTGFVSGLA
jgi:hypothetical protein